MYGIETGDRTGICRMNTRGIPSGNQRSTFSGGSGTEELATDFSSQAGKETEEL